MCEYKYWTVSLAAQSSWYQNKVSNLVNVKSCCHWVDNSRETIRRIMIRYSTIGQDTIPYNTIQYHTIPHGTIQYNVIPCYMIRCNVISYSTCDMIWNNMIPYHTVQSIGYHTIPYRTIYDLIPSHTMWYHTIWNNPNTGLYDRVQ